MSVNRMTGYTPFFLVYRAEAVIPSDLDFDALCVHFYDEQRNSARRTLTCSKKSGTPPWCGLPATRKDFVAITPDGYVSVPLL